jgi:hypothetical protein
LAAGLLVLGIATFSTLFLEAKAASVSVIVSPVSATASSTTSSSFGIGNTINQSGLSAGFISSVTDFDTYIAGNPTHTIIASSYEWFGAAGTNSGVVDYDLGVSYPIDAFALWNEESSGIGLFNLLASTDGTTYSTILSAISPSDNTLAADYGASVFGFSTTNARYFRLNLSGCPQPNPGSYQSCAIGEVALRSPRGIPPVPGPLPVLGAAIGFGYARKIRRRILGRLWKTPPSCARMAL